MKLSILIPSYNMSGKINACLESIFSQNADESLFEVIVCDSSNDDSMLIYKEWCLKHSNLKVIHNNNRTGCGIARNVAFQQSSGEYIYCVDIDDRLGKDSLQVILDALQSGLDIYYCPYTSLRDNKTVYLRPTSASSMASCPVGVWTKVYKRSKFMVFPDYMPEDVVQHFLVIDRCQSFGYIDKPIYIYDNTPQNQGAISRTFDFLRSNNLNLMHIAQTDLLQKTGLRDEYLYGVIRNIADMYRMRSYIKNPEVKKVYMSRFRNEYSNFMSGIYVH